MAKKHPAKQVPRQRPQVSQFNKSLLVILFAILILFVTTWALSSRGRAVNIPHSMTEPSESVATFGPTIANKTPAPGPASPGMIWTPGGDFSMGAQDPPAHDDVGMKATFDSRPIHRVHVDGFYMDKTDITNGEFAAFVKATGYVTVAEQTPRAEDFPGAPPENLAAGAVVFSPPNHAVPLNDHFQ